MEPSSHEEAGPSRIPLAGRAEDASDATKTRHHHQSGHHHHHATSSHPRHPKSSHHYHASNAHRGSHHRSHHHHHSSKKHIDSAAAASSSPTNSPDYEPPPPTYYPEVQSSASEAQPSASEGPYYDGDPAWSSSYSAPGGPAPSLDACGNPIAWSTSYPSYTSYYSHSKTDAPPLATPSASSSWASSSSSWSSVASSVVTSLVCSPTPHLVTLSPVGGGIYTDVPGGTQGSIDFQTASSSSGRSGVPSSFSPSSSASSSAGGTGGSGAEGAHSGPPAKTVAAATVGGLLGLAALAVGVVFALRQRRYNGTLGAQVAAAGAAFRKGDRATQRSSFYALGGDGRRGSSLSSGSRGADASDRSMLGAAAGAGTNAGPYMTDSGYVLGSPPTSDDVNQNSSSQMSHGGGGGRMPLASEGSQHGSDGQVISFEPPIGRRSTQRLSSIATGLAITFPAVFHESPSSSPEELADRRTEEGEQRQVKTTSPEVGQRLPRSGSTMVDPYSARKASAPLSVRNPDVNRSSADLPSSSLPNRRASSSSSSEDFPTPPQPAMVQSRPSAMPYLFMRPGWAANNNSASSFATLGHGGAGSMVGFGGYGTPAVQNTPHSVDQVMFGGAEAGDYFAR